MTGEQLRAALAEALISTRQLAAELDVSPMWVSRRMTGEVPISQADLERIRRAADRIHVRRGSGTPSPS